MTPADIAAHLLNEIRLQQLLYRESSNSARLNGSAATDIDRRLGALSAIERIACNTLPRRSGALDDVLLAKRGATNELMFLYGPYLRGSILKRLGG
ncbi:MAG: hypothetical protein ABS43_01670 [Bordetella sp. SCN 67-23]|nr:hypothetical protein [Burkholderiales bacterium]ODS76280.1 MAG: hypothetical protein ABS43_01670 [Bordetella sp. SCN 67-23]OJW90083.1 MAG: hypothetical protein BGO71_27605 [Burkholderiales bacterium 67-32]